jgi:hypothetical protein
MIWVQEEPKLPGTLPIGHALAVDPAVVAGEEQVHVLAVTDHRLVDHAAMAQARQKVNRPVVRK